MRAYLKKWSFMSARSSGAFGERRSERASECALAIQPYLLLLRTAIPQSGSERSAHLPMPKV